MTALLGEVRFGARQLRKSPGFTIIAILTLALGIGVNTAIFSVVEAVMLRPLPYPDPESLVFFSESNGEFTSLSPANMADYNRNRSLIGIVHIGSTSMNLTGSGAPERIAGTRVTGNFFDVIGIHPKIGRGFSLADDHEGGPRLVVLSDEIWRSRFGADPKITGKSVRLDGKPYEVTGVMPPGFESPEQFTTADRLEFYVPAYFTASELSDRGSHQDGGFARLRRGITIQQARTELEGIWNRLAQQYPKTNRNYHVVIESARSKLASGSRPALLVLLGAVVVILLIACANVANLLLARAVGQRREIAVRIALGARRGRIMRELLVQTGMLAVAGCALGLLTAEWINAFLIHLAPGDIPRLETAGLNWVVLSFTLVVCGGTVLLFGVAPAWLVSNADPQLALHGSGTRHSAGTALLRWRGLLMAGEIALSLVLLVAAGLMLKSFVLLENVPLGFEPDRVVAMNITIPDKHVGPQSSDFHSSGSTAPAIDPEAVRRLAFFHELTRRVSAIPGVESAAFGRLPLRGHWMSSYEREEHPVDPKNDDDPNQIMLDSQMCSEEYFQTLQQPVIEGRTFDSRDRQDNEPVVIVNQTFERTYYPKSSAIGHRIRRTSAKAWRRIVGVVADAHYHGQERTVDPGAFLPATQVDSYPIPLSDFAVKSALPMSKLLPAVRKAVWSLDPDQPITRVRTLSETVSQSQAGRRFQMTLLLLFGGLALALSIVGIYGVVAYSVEQRTGEIGIRMALGAQQIAILNMVVRQAMWLALFGVTAGLAVAWAATRSLASLLYSVKPLDAPTYISVSIVLALATLMAAWIPARRAARIDPLRALRHE